MTCQSLLFAYQVYPCVSRICTLSLQVWSLRDLLRGQRHLGLKMPLLVKVYSTFYPPSFYFYVVEVVYTTRFRPRF